MERKATPGSSGRKRGRVLDSGILGGSQRVEAEGEKKKICHRGPEKRELLALGNRLDLLR